MVLKGCSSLNNHFQGPFRKVIALRAWRHSGPKVHMETRQKKRGQLTQSVQRLNTVMENAEQHGGVSSYRRLEGIGPDNRGNGFTQICLPATQKLSITAVTMTTESSVLHGMTGGGWRTQREGHPLSCQTLCCSHTPEQMLTYSTCKY